jgi:hypothetical protein
VTLDPDVARVFRGDASVNKALRLVMQLVQVVEGPGGTAPRRDIPASTPTVRSGYQGSIEARGFQRKPRWEADGEQSSGSTLGQLGADDDGDEDFGNDIDGVDAHLVTDHQESDPASDASGHGDHGDNVDDSDDSDDLKQAQPGVQPVDGGGIDAATAVIKGARS